MHYLLVLQSFGFAWGVSLWKCWGLVSCPCPQKVYTVYGYRWCVDICFFCSICLWSVSQPDPVPRHHLHQAPDGIELGLNLLHQSSIFFSFQHHWDLHLLLSEPSHPWRFEERDHQPDPPELDLTDPLDFLKSGNCLFTAHSGRSANKIPAWPFVVLSFGFGAFALLPYMALWRPDKNLKLPLPKEDLVRDDGPVRVGEKMSRSYYCCDAMSCDVHL